MTYFALTVVAWQVLAVVILVLKPNVVDRGLSIIITALPIVAILWLLYALRLPGWLW